ncbi:MAG: ATPase [Bacteroides sp.]|nr:ATPase [Bacteroides sp.]
MRDTKEEIWEVISTELMPNLCHDNYLDITQNNHHRALSSITQVHFYGAGCIQPFSHSVSEILEDTFSSASIHIYSDLLGAARALCGKDEGIACILGTGSNSCLCNNGEIVRNTSPLGYILGDEGSGAVLGRILLSEMTKGNMQNLWPHFSEQYQLSISDIISKVYRQPQANRFLASLTPFIKDNLHLPSIKDMLITEFFRFLQRNVIPYGRTDLPVNFVGGIANNFTEEIMTACELCGLKSGKVVANPAKNLLKYHIHVI